MAQNPYLGLIQIVADDPTVAPGVPGVPYEFLYRTTNGALYLKTGAANTDWTLVSVGSNGITSAGYYGDGADGDVVIPNGANTQLTRTMTYRNLTIDAGGQLAPQGWRVFVSETLTINGRLFIFGSPGGNGTASAGGSAGTGFGAQEVGGRAAGGAGGALNTNGNSGGAAGSGPAGFTAGSSVGGSAGNNAINATGVGRGAGGGGGTGGSGGNGGLVTLLAANTGPNPLVPPSLFTGRISTGATTFTGGSGGAGGRGSANGGGGGGGSGGGVMYVFANRIVGSGTIECEGGPGGNGGGDGAGGGGGGGGGLLIVMMGGGTFELAQLSVAGGAGGLAGGVGGGNGGRGADGLKALLLGQLNS